jgi:hypothetical protein
VVVDADAVGVLVMAGCRLKLQLDSRGGGEVSLIYYKGDGVV